MVEFIWPRSIVQIATKYNRSINLNAFMNLEVLILSNLRLDEYDEGPNLDGLLRLRETHYFQFKFEFYKLNSETVQRYKRFFSRLRKERSSNLVISFQGIKLTDDEQFKRSDFLSNHIGLQLENYSGLIDRLTWYKQMSYTELLRVSGGFLPDDFFQRFHNIQHVIAGGLISDAISFLLFLTKCSNLRSLALTYVRISPSFYQHLPKIYNLNSLCIRALMKDLIDYSFVSELKYLSCLDTNQTLSFRFVVRAFQKSTFYLESIAFRTLDERYLIDKTGRNCYYLECYENTKEKDLIFLKKNMNLRKLAEFCRDLEDQNLVVIRPSKRFKNE